MEQESKKEVYLDKRDGKRKSSVCKEKRKWKEKQKMRERRECEKYGEKERKREKYT